jgi:hypothetical protein
MSMTFPGSLHLLISQPVESAAVIRLIRESHNLITITSPLQHRIPDLMIAIGCWHLAEIRSMLWLVGPWTMANNLKSPAVVAPSQRANDAVALLACRVYVWKMYEQRGIVSYVRRPFRFTLRFAVHTSLLRYYKKTV